MGSSREAEAEPGRARLPGPWAEDACLERDTHLHCALQGAVQGQ